MQQKETPHQVMTLISWISFQFIPKIRYGFISLPFFNMALGPIRTRGMGPLIRIPLMTWEDCVLATLDSSQPLTDFVIGGAHVRLFLKGDGVASLGSSPKSSTPNLSLTHCICL
ncbi:hypothetical protein AAG906_024924 [Vitis piasezkii]